MWPGQICTGASSLVGWAGAASSAICLAAILGAILVVTAAASAADSLVVFVKSFGPNWLCWAKTRWSCDRGGEERDGGGRARGCPAARSGSTVGGGEAEKRGAK